MYIHINKNHHSMVCYTCMCLPACLIIHTGTLSVFSPLAARNKRGSCLSPGLLICIACNRLEVVAAVDGVLAKKACAHERYSASISVIV